MWERPRGIYPVSMAMLELLLTITTSSDTTDSQLACVVFVMREMFAGYHKWRYRSISQREEIGTCGAGSVYGVRLMIAAGETINHFVITLAVFVWWWRSFESTIM